MSQIEHTYTCPYCFEPVETLIDPSITNQFYVEDCQVCCNPIEFTVKISNWELIEFQVNRLE